MRARAASRVSTRKDIIILIPIPVQTAAKYSQATLFINFYLHFHGHMLYVNS